MRAFKLASANNINVLIGAAIESVTKSTEMVHEAAVQAVAHVEKHGDWTLLKRLMLGLKDGGFRYEGLRVWIEHFSPIRFPAAKGEPGGFTVKVLKPYADGYTPFNVPEMWATPFTDFEPAKERVGKPIDTSDFIGGIMGAGARFRKLVENTTEDGKPVDPTKPYFIGKRSDMEAFLRQLASITTPVSVKNDDGSIPFADPARLGAAA